MTRPIDASTQVGQAVSLTTDERLWVNRKWAKIRQAQQKADKSNLEWTGLSESLKSYLDASGITDVVQRAKITNESLALQDALETGKWHSAEAQRHIDDLMAFLKLKELRLL